MSSYGREKTTYALRMQSESYHHGQLFFSQEAGEATDVRILVVLFDCKATVVPPDDGFGTRKDVTHEERLAARFDGDVTLTDLGRARLHELLIIAIEDDVCGVITVKLDIAVVGLCVGTLHDDVNHDDARNSPEVLSAAGDEPTAQELFDLIFGDVEGNLGESKSVDAYKVEEEGDEGRS